MVTNCNWLTDWLADRRSGAKNWTQSSSRSLSACSAEGQDLLQKSRPWLEYVRVVERQRNKTKHFDKLELNKGPTHKKEEAPRYIHIAKNQTTRAVTKAARDENLLKSPQSKRKGPWWTLHKPGRAGKPIRIFSRNIINESNFVVACSLQIHLNLLADVCNLWLAGWLHRVTQSTNCGSFLTLSFGWALGKTLGPFPLTRCDSLCAPHSIDESVACVFCDSFELDEFAQIAPSPSQIERTAHRTTTRPPDRPTARWLSFA